MKKYTILTLAFAFVILFQKDVCGQNIKQPLDKDSIHYGVDDYTADYYKVSRPNTKGDMNNTYISNNGGDNIGSIAFSTKAKNSNASRICLDVRPSGETQILSGPRRGEPMLEFNGENISKGAWGRITSTGHLAFGTDSRLINDENPDLFIHGNGSVGVGMIPPENANAKLYVKGNITLQAPNNIVVGLAAGQVNGLLGTLSNHNFRIGANVSNGQYSLFFSHDNKYLIVNADKPLIPISEANANKYGLFVLKGILSEGFAISPGSSWADYVFDKNYPLRSIDSLETFIHRHGHLPNLPSALEVEKQGYDLHEINKLFLEKIEELTLYNINTSKQIKQQNQEINFLKEQIKTYGELSKQVEQMKKIIDQFIEQK